MFDGIEDVNAEPDPLGFRGGHGVGQVEFVCHAARVVGVPAELVGHAVVIVVQLHIQPPLGADPHSRHRGGIGIALKILVDHDARCGRRFTNNAERHNTGKPYGRLAHLAPLSFSNPFASRRVDRHGRESACAGG
jgi:hypothetical protein